MLYTKYHCNQPPCSGEEDFLRVCTIMGRVALLIWFFGGFRCGMSHFLLFSLDIKIENRSKQMFSVRLAGDYLYGK